MVTTKDEKIKIEMTGLIYEIESIATYMGGTYIPPSTVFQSIHSLYPITSGRTDTWKGKLSLLKETNDRINMLNASLIAYIKNYKLDYEF